MGSGTGKFQYVAIVMLALIGCGTPDRPGDTSDGDLPQDLGTQNSVSNRETKPNAPPRSPLLSSPSPAPHDAMVRVSVYDNSEQNPLNDQAEIWIRGRGSWWIREPTRFGSATEDLVRRPLNERDIIGIYPDGRSGVEIEVPYMMTAEMNPNGSPRDTIIITISDDMVEVVGLPLEAAGGETTQAFDR